MATCTIMEHARRVLHLFPLCVALKNKLETVNETRNREQWRHAFYDNGELSRIKKDRQEAEFTHSCSVSIYFVVLLQVIIVVFFKCKQHGVI